jgi:hypothetical protein
LIYRFWDGMKNYGRIYKIILAIYVECFESKKARKIYKRNAGIITSRRALLTVYIK